MPKRGRRSIVAIAVELQDTQSEQLLKSIEDKLREKPEMVGPCWNLVSTDALMPTNEEDAADADDSFPFQYTVMGKVPKASMQEHLTLMDNRLTHSMLQQLSRRDRTIVPKLWNFGLCFQGSFPLPAVCRNREFFKGVVVDWHNKIGCFLSKLRIEEDAVLWESTGAYRLKPPGTDPDHLFTHIQHASGAEVGNIIWVSDQSFSSGACTSADPSCILSF